MQLAKIVSRRKKRLGHGAGSGKGFHTSSRGQKGQKSRRGIHVLFEGYKVKKSLIRRLPMQRGRGKFKMQGVNPMIVNLDALNLMDSGSEVNISSLVKAGIVNEADAKTFGVKILGGGELTKKLTVNLPISKSAIVKIEKAGGKVISNA